MQNPAQSLLLEYLHPKQDQRILLFEGGDGWLAREVAKKIPDGEVLSLTRDIREVRAAQTRLDSLPNAATSQVVIPQTTGWDSVLLTIPKERRFTRTLLLAAWEALKPDGRLLLAGPTKGGAKAAIKDAERLFGNASVLGYRNHQRVAVCVKGATPPIPLPKEYQQPGIAPGTQHFIQIQRPEGTLNLETHPGIFSWEALDEGTALLLEHLKIERGARVWDVGCGCGVIGLSAALTGAARVTLSDVNLLAVKFTQQNAIHNGLVEKTEIFTADGLQPIFHSPLETSDFDIIVSNPAFHRSREIDKSMADGLIAQAADLLAPHGRLLIVANHFLNYDRFMQKHFQQVKKLAETNKFHVIEARI